MKARILKFFERIDAMALRERVLIFLTAALVLVVLMYNALVEPRLAAQRKISTQIQLRQAEIGALQSQAAKLVAAHEADPDRPSRERLAKAKDELGGLEKEIAAERKRFTSPEQIKAVLEEVLGRSRNLILADLKTLPVSVITDAGRRDQGAASPGAKPGAARPEAQIYRHGVEIAVSGPYLDLLGYLQQLERLPSSMFWGRLELNVDEHPVVTMRFTVYTLSLDRAWMIV
ncbi:MAG: type II secretion system protein GspM [Sphingomonadaceae bacterium]